MRFVCDSCRAQYMISDDKVGPKGVKVRCKKCGHVILVRKTQDAAPVPAPDNGPEDEGADSTQVMSNPLASLGASIDQELTNPGGAVTAPQKAHPPDPNSLLGASDDEIGAVFDQVLNSGVNKIPGAEGGEEGEEKTQVAGGAGTALGGDDDDRMSTRVLDADTMKKLAAEAGLDGAPKAAASNGEAKNGDAKKDKDTDHDWYVAIDEKQVGPLKKEVVKEKWEAGEISADSLCWRAGFSDWIPVSEAAELASVLAPRPNKPIIVGNSPMPGPSVVSVPVESAFSSGGVTRTVRSEVQVPMAASGSTAGDEAPSGWKPSAASALASLVRDEIDALDKPAAPPPTSPSSGEGAMALGGGLLDLPPADAPHSNGNGKSAAHSPIFDEPAPAPSPRSAPMNGNTGGYAPQPMAQPGYQQQYGGYGMPPPQQQGGNKTILAIGGAVLVVLLMMGGVIIWLLGKSSGSGAVQQQQPQQIAQNTLPPVVNNNPPVEVKKPEQLVVAPKVEEKPVEKPVEAVKAEEKKVEEKPAVAEKVSEKTVDMPTKRNSFNNSGSTQKKVAKVEGGDDVITPRGKEETKKVEEPKGTDKEFDDMFGGGGKTEKKAVEEKPVEEKKSKSAVYIPPAPGDVNIPDKLGQSDIIAGVQSNVPAIKKCVSEQKAKDPSISGRIVMRWTIQTSGKVSNVSVKSEEFKSAYIGACLGTVIKAISFPKHKTQGPPVDFPFTF